VAILAGCGSSAAGTSSSVAPETTPVIANVSTTEVSGVDAVAAAGAAYYAALQSGDLAQVVAVSTARCAPAILESYVTAAADALAGFPATITVLSVGSDTASVNIDSAAVEGNSGQSAQFRSEDGLWRWDACP
jgi:hypothetical protein